MIDGPLNRYAQKQIREDERNPSTIRPSFVWLDIEAWTEQDTTLEPFHDTQKALNRAMTRIGHLIDQIQDDDPVTTGDMHYLSGLIQDAQKALRDALYVITDEDD